jgi:hypothetical protein
VLFTHLFENTCFGCSWSNAIDCDVKFCKFFSQRFSQGNYSGFSGECAKALTKSSGSSFGSLMPTGMMAVAKVKKGQNKIEL